MIILGLDPGLRRTGWGVVDAEAGRLRFVACGTVTSRDGDPLAQRLTQLHEGLAAILAESGAEVAAVEQTFVNKNPNSTLKLGMARGVVLLAPAMAGLLVAEYEPTLVKKAVVGTGRADKDQVAMMVRTLLPTVGEAGADALDALAVAITHAHLGETQARISAGLHSNRIKRR